MTDDKNLTTPPSSTPPVAPVEKEKSSSLREMSIIGVIIFVILVFRSSFFEPFKIPSGSMIPTLLVGDFILVNKFSYGLKVPFSDWFTDPIYITKPSKPKRGDIIVFKYPLNTDLNYIKRVVAIPGDRVQISNKQVYLNGILIEQNEIQADDLMKNLSDQNADLIPFGLKMYQTKDGEITHKTQMIAAPTELSNTEEFVVPEDHYFVMGDNRDNSQDSRKWGFVPFSHIKGKAFLVWFNMNIPWPKDERLNYPFMMHLDRIGKMVE